ncbi:MAG: lamin tail domain-containing protein [Pyrinomonadaceae bacterium]
MKARQQDGITAAPPETDEKGYTVGVPTFGEFGIEKTTAEVMKEQANAPPASEKPRLMVEHEGPERKNLPQDPDSKAVASTPFSDVATKRGGSLRTPPQTVVPYAPQTTSTSFTGATLADTGAFPPDTMGAVGPTQYVVFVNGRVRTFNKTTGVADGVINADSDVFFSSVLTPVPAGGVNFTSDPNVRYDRLSRRWFLTIIDVPSSTTSTIGDTPNRILIAVSDAASNGVLTAGTVWTYYFVQQDLVGVGTSTGEFLDYPSLGIDNNALYIGGNMFGAVSGSFVASSAFVIRKSSLLSGGPVVTTAFRGILPNGSSDGPFAPRGVDNYDPAANEGYFIGVSNAAFGRLIMRRVGTPGGTPTISSDILITVASTAFPINVDHLGDTGGTGGNLDALDDRLFAAHIRNGRLWTSHNIAVLPTGVASGTNAQRRDAVRWYELVVPPTTGTPTVNQSGTIFDTAATVAAARQYWIPSVTVSGQGHAAFGYSTAGTPFRIDAATNGRLAGTTLGTTGAVELYTASTTAYNPPSDPGPGRRWGDYSFTSLDPKDDMTMWTMQEFCSGTNIYGVRAVKLLAPLPATPATASPAVVTAGQPSVNVVITGTSVNGSGFYDPGADISGAEPFNHITATVSGVTVNSVTYTDPTHITLNLNTTGATAGLKSVTVTNPDGQSMTGNAVIGIQGPPTVGQALISEFRFRGTAGATDEYVELYNNTDVPVDVSGYTIKTVTAGTVFTAPGAIGSNTTVIPARGHALVTSAGYSLTAAAASNGTFGTGLSDATSVGLFAGTTASAATRIDSVGFNTTDPLFFEGTALTPATGITVNGEYAFVRKMGTASGGLPQDTDNNNNDFAFVSTTGGTFSTRVSTLGAPGPENLTSPIQRNAQLPLTLLDTSVSSSSAPNRVRDAAATGPNATFGTMTIRRQFTNNTGATVTQLRYRIVDVTTFNSPASVVPPQADLRLLNSGSTVVTVNALPVTVEGTTVETVPAQPNGGGLNSAAGRSLVAGTIINTPITAGQTVNVQFVLGVQTTGNFRFYVNIEALP